MNKGLFATVLLLALAGATGSVLSPLGKEPAPAAPASLSATPAGTVAAPSAHAVLPPLPPAVDAAPIALLFDVGAGRALYARDADRSFLPASVTKTMTAYVAFTLMAQGKLRPDQVFAESDWAYRKWHATGSRMFLERGQPVTVDQLLTGIMNISANDGCIVLAEGAAGSVDNWVALMNAEAAKLGMTHSHFGTPNGYMDNGHTYVSANDLVRLAEAMFSRYPAYYHRYVGHEGMTWNGITQRNHDPTLGNVPGADGIKTGYTGEAHYTFLGSAERGDRRLLIVLAGVPTAWQRAKAARALLEWGFSAWSAQPLFAAGALVGDAEVQGGTASSVGLVAPRAYYLTNPGTTRQQVSMRVVYRGPVVAPVAKGAPVATLEVREANGQVSYLPLVTAQAVERGGMVDRLREGLRNMFG